MKKEIYNKIRKQKKTNITPGRQEASGSFALKIAAGIVLICTIVVLLFIASGCTKPFFVPGATLGYYIWEDDSGSIHIAWSADRSDNKFSGKVSTDGKIEDYELVGLEEDDNLEISEDRSMLDFEASLSRADFTDELVISVEDYSYIEFELKINDAHVLSRTNLGKFLNNPPDKVFRITEGYFEEVRQVPFYKRPPFSGFFKKLDSDMGFSVFYMFIIGVIVIELIRITVLRKNKKYNWYLFLCYGVLIAIIAGAYFIIKIVVCL